MRSVVAALALAVLTTAGCAAGQTPTAPSPTGRAPSGQASTGPSPSGRAPSGQMPSGQMPSATPQAVRSGPITLQRTGGIAGVQDELTVQPDGTWGRAGSGTSAGRLPADRNDLLTRMAADPALRAEATRTAPEPVCADAFVYTLRVDDIRVAWTDCGARQPGVASRIARFLLEGTNPK